MPIIKAVNQGYPTPEDLDRVLEYLGRGGYLFGVGVCADVAFQQMMLVKELWHKTEGRQCRHIIVSFSNYEDLTIDEAVSYGYQIAAYYGCQFQTIFALHLNTDHMHLHFVINSVSYIDGKKYSGGWADYYQFVAYIQSLMPNWRVW